MTLYLTIPHGGPVAGWLQIYNHGLLQIAQALQVQYLYLGGWSETTYSSRKITPSLQSTPEMLLITAERRCSARSLRGSLRSASTCTRPSSNY